MPSFRITRCQRIRSGSDFERVYDGQQRAGDGALLVFALPNSLPHNRFGLSVSRKHGGAVRRGRLKRLLREAYRLSQHDLPVGLDLVLIPRQGGPASVETFRSSLVRLAGKLAQRFPKRGRSQGRGPASTERDVRTEGGES